MNGVEILAFNEVVIKYAFNWTAFWITCGIISGIITANGVWDWVKGKNNFMIIPCLFVVSLFIDAILGFVVGSALSKPIEYVTEYKVTISDEVSMNEFNEKYKIVGQDGKIYTVRERD